MKRKTGCELGGCQFSVLGCGFVYLVDHECTNCLLFVVGCGLAVVGCRAVIASVVWQSYEVTRFYDLDYT